MLGWTLFYNPMTVKYDNLLWLLLPLCASLAIVYKTVRTNNLRRLPWEILILFGYLILGMAGLGAGLWLLTGYFT